MLRIINGILAVANMGGAIAVLGGWEPAPSFVAYVAFLGTALTFGILAVWNVEKES